MKQIDSFKIDHTKLRAGIYISRKNKVGNETVTTFDIRVKAPYVEDVMSPAAAHTIEHIGATFFRNDERIRDRIIYFGPMGCLTGFYLIVVGDFEDESPEFFYIVNIIKDMFKTVVRWNGDIPGATKIECGNYKMNNLDEAKNICGNMLVLIEDLGAAEYVYPDKKKEPVVKQHKLEMQPLF